MDKSLYVGEYQHTLDDKHRLTIPSKWRFDGDEEDVYLALPNPCG
jgi:MraZ protein